MPETTGPAPSADSRGSQQRCSYAAVFDGHSAADAADMAAKRLHVLLTGELSKSGRCVVAPPLPCHVVQAPASTRPSLQAAVCVGCKGAQVFACIDCFDGLNDRLNG